MAGSFLLVGCSSPGTGILDDRPLSSVGKTLIELSAKAPDETETDKDQATKAPPAAKDEAKAEGSLQPALRPSSAPEPKPRPTKAKPVIGQRARSQALKASTQPAAGSELAGCPYVEIPRGAEVYQIYAKDGEGDPLALVYQASVNDTATSCILDENNNMRVSVGIDGRLVQGPRGKLPLSVKLPVAVVIRNLEGLLIFDRTYKVDVYLDRQQSAVRFAQVYDDIIIASKENQPVSVNDIRIEAGFPPPPSSR